MATHFTADDVRRIFAAMPQRGRVGATAIKLAAELHHVSEAEIIGPCKRREFVDARSDVAFALRKCGWSFPRIGGLLGGRDHTTIVNLIRRRNETGSD